MSDQLSLFDAGCMSADNPNLYQLGVTKDADDRIWTSAGFGGPSIAEFLGLLDSSRVNGREAMEQAAALVCLDVLAQDISKATLRLKERVRGGGERDVLPEKHYVARMLALDPNRRHTWTEFVQMMIYHLGMTSNSYAYAPRNALGDVMELIPLAPTRVQDRVNPGSREVFYDCYASTAHEIALLGDSHVLAPERDMLHIRQRMIDGFYGFSTLAAGSRTLRLNRELEDYQRTLFSKDGLKRGVFSRPSGKDSGLSDPAFDRLKSQLRKLMKQVRDGGEPILLEDGVEFKEMSMTATEAELPKSLATQIELVGKLWRMPPHKTMTLTAVKYENLTAMEMVYVRDTLVPICRLVENRLGRLLLTEQERLTMRLEFDRDEMAIADEKIENDRIDKAVKSGMITLNEGRTDAGYNPVPWGDARIVPVNTVLVDEDNNVIVSGAKNADKPASEDEGDKPAEEAGAEDKGLRLVASR